jgi:hypothetical protein
MKSLMIKAFWYLLGYRTLYISIDGNDITGTGTRKNPWRNLRKALMKVGPKDDIHILQGIYLIDTPLLVKKSVSIKGEINE